MADLQTTDRQSTVLTDGTVTLRAPTSEDAAARLALGRSPEILKWFGEDTPEDAYTLDRAEAWVAAYRAANGFAIFDNDTLVGAVHFHDLDDAGKRAEISIGLLDPSRLGQGLGTRAMRLMMVYGFDDMGLNRIELSYLDGNTRARACYDKLGFVEEGRMRESAFVDGTFVDEIMMSCLAREFIR